MSINNSNNNINKKNNHKNSKYYFQRIKKRKRINNNPFSEYFIPNNEFISNNCNNIPIIRLIHYFYNNQ